MKSNDTSLNLLLSFAYGAKNPVLNAEFFAMSKSGEANVMIDSGAFSAFGAKSKGFSHVTLDNYCNYLEQFGWLAQKYVMLDVIGNTDASRRNYETMVARGFAPMFVLTMYDNDFRYVNQTLKHCRHICVAGGATTKGDWLIQRYQRTLANTNNLARIHGLAFVTFPHMLQCGLESVDSSTWTFAAQKFGRYQVFYPTAGMRQLSRDDLARKLKAGDQKARQVADALRITPKQLMTAEYQRGDDSLVLYFSCRSNLEMQRYCYRRGLRYFFALGSASQLAALQYVHRNWDTATYDGFRKYLADFKRRCKG